MLEVLGGDDFRGPPESALFGEAATPVVLRHTGAGPAALVCSPRRAPRTAQPEALRSALGPALSS